MHFYESMTSSLNIVAHTITTFIIGEEFFYVCKDW